MPRSSQSPAAATGSRTAPSTPPARKKNAAQSQKSPPAPKKMKRQLVPNWSNEVYRRSIHWLLLTRPTLAVFNPLRDIAWPNSSRSVGNPPPAETLPPHATAAAPSRQTIKTEFAVRLRNMIPVPPLNLHVEHIPLTGRGRYRFDHCYAVAGPETLAPAKTPYRHEFLAVLAEKRAVARHPDGLDKTLQLSSRTLNEAVKWGI